MKNLVSSASLAALALCSIVTTVQAMEDEFEKTHYPRELTKLIEADFVQFLPKSFSSPSIKKVTEAIKNQQSVFEENGQNFKLETNYVVETQEGNYLKQVAVSMEDKKIIFNYEGMPELDINWIYVNARVIYYDDHSEDGIVFCPPLDDLETSFQKFQLIKWIGKNV